MYKIRLKSWGCSKYVRKQVNTDRTMSMLSIRSPDEFRISELILDSVQHHVQHLSKYNKSKSGIITEAVPGRPQFFFRATIEGIVGSLMCEVLHVGHEEPICESTGNVFAADTIADFMTSMELISHLLVEQDVDGAFSALRQIPVKIQRLLMQQPQHILHGIFHAIVKMNWDGEEARPKNSIMRAILRYTATFAADPSLGWPPTHPLRRILEGLARLDTEVQLPELAVRAWNYYMDNLEQYPQVTFPSNSTSPYTTHAPAIMPLRTCERIDLPHYEVGSISESINLNKYDIL